jgi:hypothetical protein
MALIRKKDEKGEVILTDIHEHHQVMMEWEKPYMEALVERLNPFGNVLEIGFGLGYSANAIQKYDINMHTIIETDFFIQEQVALWGKEQKHKVNIIGGAWQKELATLQQNYDSIFFDDYPLPNHEWVDGVLVKVHDSDPDNSRIFDFYDQLIEHSLVNPGARFTFFCSEKSEQWSGKVSWKEYEMTIPKNVDYLGNEGELYLPLITFK